LNKIPNQEEEGKNFKWDDVDTDDEDEDDDEEREKETKPKPLPKISYTDKMLVSVMGAVFNMLLAFALSCVLYFFGYDVSDAQLTTKVGYVADTVERWNPLVSEGEEVTGPGKKAGLLAGDEIIRVDGSPVENFMDIQNRIVTGKEQTAQG
jgi:regulator of sigma E protease